MPGFARTPIDLRPSREQSPADLGERAAMTGDSRLRFLFATAETHPTHRADVRVLFGKCLPELGIATDLVAACPGSSEPPRWGGGRLLASHPRSKAGGMLADLAQQLALLWRCFQGYDGLIVRDKPFLGLIGLAATRIARIPFVYWMSFPMPEAYLEISRDSTGSVAWTRRAYARVRGVAGSWALYRAIVPFADHLFVQSPVMLDELLAKGLSHRRVTPVPMGVDVDALPLPRSPNAERSEPRDGGRTAVYLGTLDRLRRHELELMVDAAKIVGKAFPDFELLVIGESDTESEKGWLRRYAETQGAATWVRFVGWLPYDEGLALAGSCAMGLSPFPRGKLFESASPTKAIEYLALGLPVVCNDQPDQARVVRESGGGICVQLTAEAFAHGIQQLIEEPERARTMGQLGREWVRENRSYRRLAATVADPLRALCHRRHAETPNMKSQG